MYLVSFPYVCNILKFKKKKEMSPVQTLYDSVLSRAGEFLQNELRRLTSEQAWST